MATAKTTSTTATIAATSETLPVLQITNWPLRQQRPFVFVVTLAIIVVSALTGRVMHHWLFGLLTFLALIVATWRMWIPVRFKLDSRGVRQTVWLRRSRMPWSKVARYVVDPNGVLLLYREDAFPLSALRGTYIHIHEEREALLNILETYCAVKDR